MHGIFVFGFEEDDPQRVKEIVKFAKRSRLTPSRILILTLLPGSELYHRMEAEGRIQFKDWSLYDVHPVVFKCFKFSFGGLQWAQIVSHQQFYSRIEKVRKLIRGK